MIIPTESALWSFDKNGHWTSPANTHKICLEAKAYYLLGLVYDCSDSNALRMK